MSLRYFPEGSARKWYESSEGDFKWTCLIYAIVIEKINLLGKYNI